MLNVLTIAVDFDGTIVENRYPKIGKPMLFALETLKKLQDDGHQLILWTYRSGKELQEAVEFCNSKGIYFYAVNMSYPEEKYDDSISRKIQADYFIDDRNIGGLMGWGEIYQRLVSEDPVKRPKQKKIKKGKTGKSVLSFFKSKL
jgi:hydroxymethylpyrimidine pyrophosphatase-like HAD family hydrolase